VRRQLNAHPEWIAPVAWLICLTVLTPRSASAWAWNGFSHCFFEEGSASLTEKCKRIITDTVTVWHAIQDGRWPNSDDLSKGVAPPHTARIELRAYTQDASNPDEDNILATRRATAITTELERLGIPSELITVVNFGAAYPMVPNAPKDPLNRRVQIVFQP
jgi:outer membrane protein OmpA-like peptidoglycan-associated protein